MLTDTMKDELIRGLLDIFHNDISMIILYGSAARNEATSESDIDIAIIMKKIWMKMRRISLSVGLQIWIFVMTGFFQLLIFRKKI